MKRLRPLSLGAIVTGALASWFVVIAIVQTALLLSVLL